MFTDFIAHYAEHIADRSRPFPGLADALDELAAAGFRFAVCTNKLERLSLRLLNSLKLSHRFAAICGQDTFGIQKPDPEVLRRTIAAASSYPRRAIMIGDSHTDIRTAPARPRFRSSPSISAIASDRSRNSGPDRVISQVAQLPGAVAAISFSRNDRRRKSSRKSWRDCAGGTGYG